MSSGSNLTSETYQLGTSEQMNKFIPRGTEAVTRLTIKDQKVGNGPVPGDLCLFPQIVRIILSLISL